MTQETKDKNKSYFLVAAAAIVGSFGGNIGDDLFKSGSNDEVMKTQIAYISDGFKEFRSEMKDYLKELATKGDIERLEGMIRANEQRIDEIKNR